VTLLGTDLYRCVEVGLRKGGSVLIAWDGWHDSIRRAEIQVRREGKIHHIQYVALFWTVPAHRASTAFYLLRRSGMIVLHGLRTGHGSQLLGYNFRGERIVYELTPQEAEGWRLVESFYSDSLRYLSGMSTAVDQIHPTTDSRPSWPPERAYVDQLGLRRGGSRVTGSQGIRIRSICFRTSSPSTQTVLPANRA
jgi:hypothetical protein